MTVERRSPLEHLVRRLEEASDEAVAIAERPFLAQVDVRLPAGEGGAAAVAEALGFALPAVPNTTATGGGRTALWLGPGEWLVVGAPGSEGELVDCLQQALAGDLGAVVDVSANRTAVELTGTHAREVLEKGCSVDLHPRAFGAGRCAQTTVARAQVLLEQFGDEPAYRLYVRPSFAGYLAAWLLDAAMEFRPAASIALDSAARRQRSVRATSLNV